MEKINTISSAVIAISTIIGVSGAIGTFLLDFGLTSNETLKIIIVYITVMFVLILGLWRTVK